MDTYNSAMAEIRPDGEILTAAGWKPSTSANSAFRFTQILIDEIKALNGRAITACDLHANLLTNALKNNMDATPIHKANMNNSSVLIHKIGTREARDLIQAPLNNLARVLITVSIAANKIPNVNDWDKWLSAIMPTGIRDVEIIANWNSSSRTILVCIPIQIWDYLRDDPSYSFVSFILGDVNIGLPPPPEAIQGRSTSKAKENVPPRGSTGPNVGDRPSSSGGPLLPIRPQPGA